MLDKELVAAVGRGFLQSTDEEHHGDADLLLPVEVEISDLPHGDCNHP